MKKIILNAIAILLVLSLCSCSLIFPDKQPDNPPDDGGTVTPGPDDQKPNPDDQKPNPDDQKPDPDPVDPPEDDYIPKIFLAGDSTVKTYEDNQFIAGWGQYLGLFLDGQVEVINAAHGGRSSRSFINEGRLFDIEGSSYTFSQNGGNSIADGIGKGDYLFIQFGHNDDDTKAASSYSSMFDRMVPLGEPDENGIYPTIPAEKTSTAVLPDAYTAKATDAEEAKALAEIAKYGSEYYAYGSGTYKWYLKQYIDFARSVGAIPVLVTPVARVKFSGGTIIGGAGLHGENFAYVQAVRQLAAEEDCLLIDLFAESKAILETATPTYANYLMALKPNELTGVWPVDYDSTYGNTEAGYAGIEATHYNKYGAFLQAAKIADHILQNKDGYSFAKYLLAQPRGYIDPSNLIGKNTVDNIEVLFSKVNVFNPDRVYNMPEAVVALIDALAAKGEVTADNYLAIGEECEAIRTEYYKLNVDFRHLVTNISTLEEYEAAVEALIIANRPTPTRVVMFDADDLALSTYDSTVTEGDFTFVATSDKTMQKKSKKVTFTYNGNTFTNEYGLSLGGSAKFGTSRYVSFTTQGPCIITVAAQSSGSEARTLNMVDSSSRSVGAFEAGTAVTLTTVEISEAGSYSIGSAGSGIYIFQIIIEYFE